MKQWLFLGCMVLGGQSLYGLPHHYQLQAGARSFPRSGTLEAHAYLNQHLWKASDESLNWKYGFWKAGGFVATHGQAALKVDIFPISFWQVGFQKGITSRFYETLTLDCEQINCGGQVIRDTLRTTLALAYKDFFLIPSYSRTHLSLVTNGTNPTDDFSSEEDNLVASKAGDDLLLTQVVFGFKAGQQRWLFLNKESHMQESGDWNHSQYVVWSKTVDQQWNYFVGAGQYRSNHAAMVGSVVAGFNWSMGENLSLF